MERGHELKGGHVGNWSLGLAKPTGKAKGTMDWAHKINLGEDRLDGRGSSHLAPGPGSKTGS